MRGQLQYKSLLRQNWLTLPHVFDWISHKLEKESFEKAISLLAKQEVMFYTDIFVGFVNR